MVWGGRRRRGRRVCVEGRVGEDSVELGEYMYLPYLLRLLPTLSMQATFDCLISNYIKTVQTSHRIPLRQRLFPRRCRQRCSSLSQISQYWRVSSHLPIHLLPSSLPTNQPLTPPPLLFFPFSQKHQRPQHLHRPQHHLFHLRSFPRGKFLQQKR